MVRADLRRRAPHPLTATARLVALGEHELYVHEWGEPSARTVLWWHGLGSTGQDADAAARVMAGEFRCRVIAPDAPGLGQSPPLRRGSLSAGAAAGLTRALLDSLGVELCAAVGHSWGADVACLVAAADPARVRALVLLDGGFVDAADWPWNRLRRSVPTAVWAAIARRQGTAGPRPWAEAVRAHARGAPVSTAYPAVAASGAAVLVLLAETYEPSMGRARERGLARLRRALPDADVRVLPSVGHDLPGEAGPEVGRIMGEWL